MSTLPPLPPEGAGVEELRAAVRALILWANSRDPGADGGTQEKFLTIGDAMTTGLLGLSPGLAGTGSSGDVLIPGAATDPFDSSAPNDITGLAVAAGVSHYLVQWDAPTYAQGGGNGRTVIYAANYSGTGPLPTFSSAVEIGAAPGKAVILVVAGEPGVIKRFWAKAETRYPTLQASPSGGINGVGATADLIEDQHVLNLTAGKLLAGEIGVSEYIRSAGYTGSGVSEWSIGGDGVARFTGVIVSGNITATAGSFANVTIAGALTMNTSGHIKGGQTAYNTGTGFFLGYDSAAYKFSIGNASLGMTWDGADLTINGGIIVNGDLSGSLVRNASGNVLLNAGATGTARPPWVVGGSSIGGGLDLTTGTNTDNAMELRSMVAGPGIALGYSTTGAVQVSSTLPINEEVQLAADETTTTVGITPTNMSLALAINKTYAIRGRLLVRSALATTGHVVGCNVPTSAATVLRVTSQATESTAQQRVLNLPTGGSGTVVFTEHFAATQAAPTVFDSGSSSIIEFDAVVKVGATAGVFELIFGSEVSGSSVTLLAGSSMTAQALKAGVATASALAGTPAYTTPIEAARATGNSIPATALATISLKRDGTWAATRTGNTSTSGNWASTTSADLGLQWLIKYVPTSGTLSANGAADWTSLGATVTASVSAFSPTGSGILSTKTCTTQIILKNVLTGVETTVGTVTLYAEAESDSDTANP